MITTEFDRELELAPRTGRILGVDPGPVDSGWCMFDGQRVLHSGVSGNREILKCVASWGEKVAIEMIASYGMPVGREVFETCVWIGRFIQASKTPDAVRLVYRRDVKMHLCGSSKAKDGNVRQAMIDMFPRTGGGATPQIGVKKKPGPLYGVSTHAWPALAVCITALHTETA
jgi:hypothetical protein